MKRLVGLILGGFGAIALFPKTAPAAPPQVGETVTIRFKAVDGAWVNTDTLRGKLVVFDFWATWCGPCMQMVPHMVEMNQKYAAKGLQIVGISLDSDRAEMLKVTKEKGMVWPEYFDGAVWDNKIWKEYGAKRDPIHDPPEPRRQGPLRGPSGRRAGRRDREGVQGDAAAVGRPENRGRRQRVAGADRERH